MTNRAAAGGRTRGGAALSVCVLAVAFAPRPPELTAAVDPEVQRLRPGVLLYAAPDVRDPNFSETVVLLIQYGPKGAMGLVIDHPSEGQVEEALPEAKTLRGQPLYWGGPVQPETIIGLVRTARPSPEAVPLLGDVYLTGSREDLEVAARDGKAREHVRVYSGYAGWGAGQLEAEVMRNGWIVARGDVAAIFSPEPQTLWRKVRQLIRSIEA